MAFTILHLPTLFMVTAMVVGFSGIMLVLARGRGQSAIAPTLWGTAMMMGAAGIICLALEPAWGPIAERAGNVLILLGTGLSWAAARAFVGRRVEPAVVLAGATAWLLWDTLWHAAGTLNRPILAMLFGSAYTVAVAAELWRGRDEKLQSRMFAIVLLLFHAGIYLGRAMCIALLPQDDWLGVNHMAAVMMIEALLHTLAMSFLLLALLKERAELQSTVRLHELAMVDGLTGLGNRRAFDRDLSQAFRRAIRDRAPLGLLMIDADRFKAYNDTYGHQAGDDCLRAIASAIQSAARRPGDAASRYGGEEFAMLLPATDEAGAVRVAQTILENVRALGIEHASSPQGQVSVSIGVAAIQPGQGPDSAGLLVEAADRSLYRAKMTGRNRVQMTTEPLCLSAGWCPQAGLQRQGEGGLQA